MSLAQQGRARSGKISSLKVTRAKPRCQWPEPAADVQKHYGYAFQWFALCALILGLYVWFQLIRPRRARHTGRA